MTNLLFIGNFSFLPVVSDVSRLGAFFRATNVFSKSLDPLNLKQDEMRIQYFAFEVYDRPVIMCDKTFLFSKPIDSLLFSVSDKPIDSLLFSVSDIVFF